MDHLTGQRTLCVKREGEGERGTDSVVTSEESRVGALTEVEGASLAQLRLQLLPVSQRVGEFLEIFLCKYWNIFWNKLSNISKHEIIECKQLRPSPEQNLNQDISPTLSRTPSDESLSVSTDDGEVREGIVSEIIKQFYDWEWGEDGRVSVKTGLRRIFLFHAGLATRYSHSDQNSDESQIDFQEIINWTNCCFWPARTWDFVPASQLWRSQPSGLSLNGWAEVISPAFSLSQTRPRNPSNWKGHAMHCNLPNF